MNKILKYKFVDKDKHFFSSDWHINHNPQWPIPIWKSRGFNSHQEHADDVKNKINAKVGADDILWFLGDMFLNSTDGEVKEWLAGINCQNIMTLWGNHESNTFRLYKEEVRNQFGLAYGVEDVEVYPLRMNNVVFLGNHQEIFIGKQRIILNHFSLRIWHKNNSKHKSPAWMLSGHSHNSDKGRNPDSPYGKAVDVGIDWGNIWSFNEISDIMSTKTVEILDHHDSHTT